MMKRLTSNLDYFRVNYALFFSAFLTATLTSRDPNFIFVLALFVLIGGFLGLQDHPIRIGENFISVATLSRVFLGLLILSLTLVSRIFLLYMSLLAFFIICLHGAFHAQASTMTKVDQLTQSSSGLNRTFQRIGQVLAIALGLRQDEVYNAAKIGAYYTDRINDNLNRTADSVKDAFSSLKRAAKADFKEIQRNAQ